MKLLVWVQLSNPEKGTHFISAENHCYLLILIYSNGSANQKLIKHCVLCNDGTGKVLNGHRIFIYRLNSSLGLTGNSSTWLEGTHLHLTGEPEYRQGCSWRCQQILSSSGAILHWALFPSASLMVDSGNWNKWDVKSENVQLDSLESNRKPVLCCASCHKGKIYRSVLSVTWFIVWSLGVIPAFLLWLKLLFFKQSWGGTIIFLNWTSWYS